MIKLIASDMDGTLLNDEKQLPSDFFEVLDMVIERGIVFTVASGRTYSALEHLFPEPYKDKVAYICDNGACTVLGGKTVDVTPLDMDTYREFLTACRDIGNLHVVVCAENGVYHIDRGDEFSREVGRFYKKHSAVGDLFAVNETVYKVAVCDELGTLAHGKPALDAIFGDRLNVQASGVVWMDVMASGVSKGTALAALQERLGIGRSETMVFGDYFNDVEMLQLAMYSFCMDNGHEDVKKMCRYIAPDNNHGGVTKCIREFALAEEVGEFNV